jgi:aminoglycoside phosphotransferase (APT) family kinase protein
VKYSERELDYLRQVRETGFESGEIRVIRPLGTWSGVLFLEYEEGLTLKDLIAVRQTFPGKLRAGLRGVARFLAKLHSAWQQPETSPDVERAIKDNLDYVEDLAQHGVLKTEARIAASLESMISEWARDPLMASFTPTLIHGDATTTNFVVLDDGSLVALDLERLKVADPAADLGRLAAEVFHSLREAGGDGTETESLLQVCFGAYREALPSQSQVEDVLNRTCFYQGTSLLRIARNGWIPRLERMSLVAQAMALLSQGSS